MTTTTDTRIVTVLGATGRTGGRATRRLLDAGVTVRAVGRTADRIPVGAEAVIAGLLDTDAVTAAFTGADAAYVMLPFDPADPDVGAQLAAMGTSVAQALGDSGVPRVVALSSIGADVPRGTGFLASLHDQEARLRQLDSDVLLLRPGYFYDNIVEAIQVMVESHVLADSIDAHVALPMVATADVGDVAARELLAPGWTGVVVRELKGPRDLTMSDLARISGDRLGVDVRYVRMPDDAMAEVLRQVGFSASASDLLLQMHAAFSDGTVVSRDENAPRLPTTFDEFVADTLAGVRS